MSVGGLCKIKTIPQSLRDSSLYTKEPFSARLVQRRGDRRMSVGGLYKTKTIPQSLRDSSLYTKEPLSVGGLCIKTKKGVWFSTLLLLGLIFTDRH